MLLVIGLMLACYAVALNAYWVGDDYNYVRPKDWTTVFNFFDPRGRAVYRPLNWSIWAADFALFGDNPLAWRLTRLGIHALNIVWCALLVRSITGRIGVALLAAALFAVHPAQTETVTWMGGQADISFALAYLPAVLLFVLWRQGGGRGLWVAAGVLGALSMLGKEAAITLPLATLWADLVLGRGWARWPGRRDSGWWRDWRLWGRLVRDHSPFIAAAGLYVAMRLYLYFTGQGRLMYGAEEQLGFFSRGTDVLAGYAVLATGPWWVAQEVFAWPLPLKLLVVVIAASVLFLLVRWLGRVALFAVGWSGITLLLTLQAVANRWFYLPAFGMSLLVALAWERLHVDSLRQRENSSLKRVLSAIPLAILIGWSVLTLAHNELWRQSGEVARNLMAQVRSMHPNPPRPATFYVANPPQQYKSVLLFNSGFAPAVNLTYHDWDRITTYNLSENKAQVEAALADPTKVGPNPVFLRYEDGKMVPYSSLQTLVEADDGE